jgi:hypothetical protein
VRIHTLEFGSLLSYAPRGFSDKIRSSRDVTLEAVTKIELNLGGTIALREIYKQDSL